jgi:hypothetical protein
MVREWGMSEKVGPMAWHGQQQVFLGEDLMTGGREYSDSTARLMDEEIQTIQRDKLKVYLALSAVADVVHVVRAQLINHVYCALHGKLRLLHKRAHARLAAEIDGQVFCAKRTIVLLLGAAGTIENTRHKFTCLKIV